MYEQYLFSLNEIYFGKNMELKQLEELLDKYIEICKKYGKFYNIEKDDFINTSQILSYKKTAHKKLLYNNEKSKPKMQIKSRLELRNERKSEIMQIVLSIFQQISDLIKDMFNFFSFDVKIHSDLGATSHTLNTNIKKVKNDYIVIDEKNRSFYLSEIQKAIIVTENGIKFDKNKLSIQATLYITNPNFIKEFNFLSNELLAMILHEIGHCFSKAFLQYRKEDDNLFYSKLAERQDEIFADKFVSLYGYSKDLVQFFKKANSSKINYDTFKRFSGYQYNVIPDSFKDVHPQYYTRLLYLLHHLQIELKDPSLSIEQRKKINKDIKNLKYVLKDFKYDPIIKLTDNDDKKEFVEKYYKNQYPYLINQNLSLDTIDRFYQKSADIDSRYIKSKIDNIYQKKYDDKINYITYTRDETFYKKIVDTDNEFSEIAEFYQLTKNYLSGNTQKIILSNVKSAVDKYFENQINWYVKNNINKLQIRQIMNYLYETIEKNALENLQFSDNKELHKIDDLTISMVCPSIILLLFTQTSPAEICIEAEKQLFGKML